MTILFNQQAPAFDPDPALDEPDHTQPITIDSNDDFVVITQWDSADGGSHYLLIERRDMEKFIEALRRS